MRRYSMKRGIWDRVRRFIFRIQKGATLETLSLELRHSDATVRQQAARSLGDLGDPAAIIILFDAIRDENEGVKREVVTSLKRLGWKPSGGGEMIVPSARPDHDGEDTPSIQQDTVDRLVLLLRDPDPSIRRDTVSALGELGNRAALDPLLQCLDDPDPSVQQSARAALKRLGWSSETLIPQDPVERGRYLLARKQWAELESMGADAVNPLIDALHHHDKYVRWRAARTLGRLGSARAIGPLIQAFRDPDMGVRKGVAYALGKLTGDPLVAPLDRVLNEKEDSVRLEAAKILGLRQDTRILEPLIQMLSLELQNPDTHVRSLTSDIMAKLSVGLPISANPTSPADQPQPDDNRSGSLGIGDATSVEAVIDMLEDPKQERRLQKTLYKDLLDVPPEESLGPVPEGTSAMGASAANALSGIGDPNAARTQIAALGDPNPKVQRAAVQALERCWDPESLRIIVGALGTPDEAVRALVQEVLVRIGAPAVGLLIDAFTDRNTELRGRAAEILVTIGRPSVESLIQTLQDPSDLVRWRAARTMGKIADPRAIQPLIEALGEDDILLRRDAANALRVFGAEAVDPLILALQDASPRIRKEAAEVLGWLGDRRAIKPLLIVLEHPSTEIRCAAIWALGELGDSDMEETIRPLLSSPDPQVQGVARTALGKLHGKSSASIQSSA
ncbi:MAG: HEAT repeat domain-containing protein [Methanomicrobiales archaeon]|nr:HEAT repeat domain-containing protein [Methanomicrobiales archaeon]